MGAGEVDLLWEREKRQTAVRGDAFTCCTLPIALRVSSLFLRQGLSANLATALMLATGVGGGILASLGTTASLATGLTLLWAHHVFDYVDGQIARHRGAASVLGAVRDRWIHFAVQHVTFIGLAVGLTRRQDGVLAVAPVLMLYVWNELRHLLASLPTLIAANELSRYPKEERDQMLCDLEAAGVHEQPRATSAVERPQTHDLRAATSSFTFLIFLLGVAAWVDVAWSLFCLRPRCFEFGTWFLAALALVNTIDFSCTYMFTDRVYRDIREHRPTGERQGARDYTAAPPSNACAPEAELNGSSLGEVPLPGTSATRGSG